MKIALQNIPYQRQFARLALAAVLSSLLASCSDYTWTFNERVVYAPPELLKEFTVEDPALSGCLQQAIEDQQLVRAEQLESLRCSDAGISTLSGLEQFVGLRRLNLDNNQIADVAPLALLPRLELLHLRHNSLTTLAPLICAPRLSELALLGNAEVSCTDLDYLENCEISVSDAPAHCLDVNHP